MPRHHPLQPGQYAEKKEDSEIIVMLFYLAAYNRKYILCKKMPYLRQRAPLQR